MKLPDAAPPTPSADATAGLPRVFDVALAAFALLALLPLLGVVSLVVGLSSPGGVLYRQERVGRGGRCFTLVKFRSMRQEQGHAVTVAGDRRITPVGRLLRRTKLDELPELWNVIRGELTLVGSRPEVPRYVDPGDPLWQEVLRTRPGLTHPVTLALQNEESLLAKHGDDPETFYRQRLLPYKLRGYLEYQQQRSAWSDLGVLFQTARQLLPGQSIAPPEPEELSDVRG